MTLSSVICNSSIRARRNVIIPPRYDRMNSIKRWVSLSLPGIRPLPSPSCISTRATCFVNDTYVSTNNYNPPPRSPLISPSDSKRKYTTTPSTSESEFSSLRRREEDSSKRIPRWWRWWQRRGRRRFEDTGAILSSPSFRSTEISRRKKRDEPRIPNSTYVTCASASTAF